MTDQPLHPPFGPSTGPPEPLVPAHWTQDAREEELWKRARRDAGYFLIPHADVWLMVDTDDGTWSEYESLDEVERYLDRNDGTT